MFDWIYSTFGRILQLDTSDLRGDVMSCQSMNSASAGKVPAWASLIESLTSALLRHGGAAGTVDLDDMPDRMKRDMGFLDGREPYYEEEARMR
jgi:hypothetical protein